MTLEQPDPAPEASPGDMMALPCCYCWSRSCPRPCCGVASAESSTQPRQFRIPGPAPFSAGYGADETGLPVCSSLDKMPPASSNTAGACEQQFSMGLTNGIHLELLKSARVESGTCKRQCSFSVVGARQASSCPSARSARRTRG